MHCIHITTGYLKIDVNTLHTHHHSYITETKKEPVDCYSLHQMFLLIMQLLCTILFAPTLSS